MEYISNISPNWDTVKFTVYYLKNTINSRLSAGIQAQIFCSFHFLLLKWKMFIWSSLPVHKHANTYRKSKFQDIRTGCSPAIPLYFVIPQPILINCFLCRQSVSLFGPWFIRCQNSDPVPIIFSFTNSIYCQGAAVGTLKCSAYFIVIDNLFRFDTYFHWFNAIHVKHFTEAFVPMKLPCPIALIGSANQWGTSNHDLVIKCTIKLYATSMGWVP